MNIKIKEGTIEDALALIKDIPELNEVSFSKISGRIYDKDFLILIGYLNNVPAGFKIGYDRYNDGSFYTWLGGVLPEYRRKTLGKLMAKKQRAWVKDKGFSCIRLKTQNIFKEMICLALSDGFMVTKFEAKEPLEESIIQMEKKIR